MRLSDEGAILFTPRFSEVSREDGLNRFNWFCKPLKRLRWFIRQLITSLEARCE
jgi:hypothetical protein